MSNKLQLSITAAIESAEAEKKRKDAISKLNETISALPDDQFWLLSQVQSDLQNSVWRREREERERKEHQPKKAKPREIDLDEIVDHTAH